MPVVLALAATACVSGRGVAGEAAIDRPQVELIRIHGSINPAVAEFVEDALAAADAGGARALVIELDTPGGLMASAERIVKDLLGAKVPVIVYVAPAGASAASAGTFITEAAHIAAMAPGTTIGAAHPVGELGGQLKGVMGTKVENFVAGFARSIARQRGRNEDWAEEAVRHSVVIGEREALRKHVIDLIAANLHDLFARASGRTVTIDGRAVVLELGNVAVQEHSMTLGQRMFDLLSDPNLVYLLMLAGLLGLYFEFAHPGVFLPGVAGAICLLLALTSFEVLPVTVSGLLLILLGVGMLIAEAFITSYGILGLGGLAALVIGSLLFIDTSKTNLVVNRNLIYATAGTLAAIILGLALFLARERRRMPLTGSEGLLGAVGEIRQRVAPGAPGTVFVHGELWRATSEDELAERTRARVVAIEGLVLKVRKADS